MRLEKKKKHPGGRKKQTKLKMEGARYMRGAFEVL